MDFYDNLAQAIRALSDLITNWRDYQDDLRNLNPVRKVVIALLLAAIIVCTGFTCLLAFPGK